MCSKLKVIVSLFALITLLLHCELIDHAASCNAPVKNMSEDYAGICIEFLQMTSDLQFELQI